MSNNLNTVDIDTQKGNGRRSMVKYKNFYSNTVKLSREHEVCKLYTEATNAIVSSINETNVNNFFFKNESE